jgi:hypothetical protein
MKNSQKPGFWNLQPSLLQRISGRLPGGRNGFQLHPGTHSDGCITAQKNDRLTMDQYNDVNNLLNTEDGSNTIEVIP